MKIVYYIMILNLNKLKHLYNIFYFVYIKYLIIKYKKIVVYIRNTYNFIFDFKLLKQLKIDYYEGLKYISPINNELFNLSIQYNNLVVLIDNEKLKLKENYRQALMLLNSINQLNLDEQKFKEIKGQEQWLIKVLSTINYLEENPEKRIDYSLFATSGLKIIKYIHR